MGIVLLTGFGPYGNTPINPAESAASALHGATVEGARVVARVVPSLFFESIKAVQADIAEVQPQVVIMLGEYAGRSMITVERIAQNFIDATRYGLADNDGQAPQDRQVVPGGPVAYHTTLPIRAMVKAMRAAGIPADISDAAGTFMCNQLMYGVLHHIASSALPIRAGWIHLPHLPSTAALPDNLGAPSMSAETSIAGVRAAIGAVVTHNEDIREPSLSRLQI